MYTYVTCRIRPVECGKGNVLCLHECSCFLFYTDTQIGFCHAGQSVKSCLEVCFLALQDELEVGSQRVAVESGDKDCFRRHRRVGDYVVRTLADKGEHTGLQQCVLHFLCAHLGRVHLAELLVVLLGGSLYHDVQHLTTCTAFHARHYAAYGRNKFQFRMILVDKQGSPGHHILLFLHHHFRSDTRKIIGNQRVESRLFHRHKLFGSFAFQVDVKAFA